jgi:hypothetical protein
MTLKTNYLHMKISIENPCHENWDAMTPNEKGAFCLSCQKNVVDFSKKTLHEIKSFFTELPATEKVCGRFEEKQLDSLTFEHFFQQFRNWRLFHKMAVVIFFTFGISLFGCAQSGPKDRNLHLKGDVAFEAPVKDTTKKCRKDTLDEKMIMGKMIAPPKEERMILGELAVPVKENTPYVGDQAVPNNNHHIMGGPKYTPDPVPVKKKPVRPNIPYMPPRENGNK